VPRNLQRYSTGTVRSCNFCGQTFIVEANPSRSGEFCSRPCALQFSRQSIRSTEQRKADLRAALDALQAKSAEDARRKIEHDAEQLRKSNTALREFQALQSATEAATQRNFVAEETQKHVEFAAELREAAEQSRRDQAALDDLRKVPLSLR
jgi:protein subunit release factor A